MSRSTGLPAASRSHPEGFTLVEVLVAFAIAATLLLAVLSILTMSLEGGERSEAYTKATILAESTLDSLGVVTPLRDAETADLVDGPFSVHAAVERYQDPEEETGTAAQSAVQYVVLYRVSAAVTWRRQGHGNTISLSTLKLGPPPQP
ncbi:MAG TPA: prepilin-type N-terminal cleavage/methylation domain-containing protein [Stellaceae bacterium]|nr:prepilin-type N-terminal cleavage/methylation domain-containing protein [Stellaceae bacterium]